MRLFLLLFGFFAIVLALAFLVAPLATFNALVPKDAGVGLVARDVAYGADQRQRYDVYRPVASGTYPLLVFVYGGGWQSGDKAHYEFAARAFAARGYVVAVTDYRLVPQIAYPAFVEDVALAIAHAQHTGAQFGANVSRTYLVGHSAGAYNIAQAVLQRDFLVAAGVDEKAIKAVATLAGPFDFLPLDVKYSREAFGHLPETQPVNHARADAPPFLILHGDADDTVFLRSPRALEKALKAAGADVTVKIYPGISHVRIIIALSKLLRAKVSVLDDVTAFFSVRR
jgi:acetyl esterase/lipase